MNSKQQALKSYPALNPLGNKAARRLSEFCDLLTIDAGSEIARAGQRVRHCMVVLAGQVRPDGSGALLSAAEVPTQALWRQQPTTVVANSDVILLIFDRRHAAEFERLVVSEPPEVEVSKTAGSDLSEVLLDLASERQRAAAKQEAAADR